MPGAAFKMHRLGIEGFKAFTAPQSLEIKADDAVAVAPAERNEQGYLAVLDIAEPVRWAPIEYSRIRRRLGRQPLATMHALAHRELARACTDAFAERSSSLTLSSYRR